MVFLPQIKSATVSETSSQVGNLKANSKIMKIERDRHKQVNNIELKEFNCPHFKNKTSLFYENIVFYLMLPNFEQNISIGFIVL